jgi:REP element-mobilizing transposase RayT
MARRLRIQFAGARYHVINRGNLQHDVFATGGAIASFIRTLQAAVGRFRWRLHAFVVMRNHFHLALATPEPNLVAGMHWLQSTFAVRLTRFHRQHGHVFQGRYRSLLIEDDAHLARVCDYIHLNPVRAGVLGVERLRDYRASSLWHWLRGRAPGWLDGEGWLAEAGLGGVEDPWARYLERLRALTHPQAVDERTEPGAFSRGWAIGTEGWRRALAREYRHLALAPEMSAAEIRELREARWRAALEEALARQGRQAHELALAAKGAPWKLELARDLRVNAAVPHAWIAAQLRMGTPSSLRANLSRRAIRIAVEGEWPRSAVGRVDHPVGSTISGLTPSIRDPGRNPAV